MTSLREELTEHVGWLILDFGFKIINDGYDAKSFGDSYATLASPSFRLRLTRDRGEISAEIASVSEPNTWWGLHCISELIPGANPPHHDLASVAAFVHHNFFLLSDFFGTGYLKAKDELKRLDENRKQEMMRSFARR
ncbi:MAG: hypothetical protein ACO1QB_09255 [Verrucomicrobiales bacterium]